MRAATHGIFAGFTVFVSAAVCLAMLFSTAKDTLRETVNQELLNIAKLAARAIDPAVHSRLTGPDQMNRPEYSQAVASLRLMLADMPHIRSMYTLRQSSEGIRLGIDASLHGDLNRGQIRETSTTSKLYSHMDPTLAKAFTAVQGIVSEQPYSDKRGTLLTAYAPVRHQDGRLECVLAVDMDFADYLQRVSRMSEAQQVGLAFAVALSALVAFGVWLVQCSRIRQAIDLERLSMVATHTSNAVAITDANQRIVWVNDGFARMTGFSKHEVVGKVPQVLLKVQTTDPEAARVIDEAAAQGRGVRLEVCKLTRAGEPFWVDLDVQPIRDARHRLIGFIRVQTDITHKLKLRDAMRASEDRLVSIVDNVNVGLWEWNPQTDSAWFNDRWCTMLGYKPDEIVQRGETWMNLVHPEDKPALRESLDKILTEDENNWRCEFRLKGQGGEYVWIEAAGRVMDRDAEGHVHRISGVQMDVTQRKLAELAATEATSRLQAFVENAPAAVAMFDREMRYVASSRQWSQDYGLGELTLTGRLHEEVVPEGHERWREIHERCLDGSIERCDEDQVELRGRGTQWIKWEIRPWHQPNGEIGGSVICTQDITVRKVLEAQLRSAASIDRLTGLPNRATITEQLQGAISRLRRAGQDGYALLYLDFDRFKLVNDSLGHRAGDELLRQIATRLRLALASFDRHAGAPICTPGRLGGDEFVVLIESVRGVAQPLLVAERLVAEFCRPYLIDEHQIVSTASIGVVMGDGSYALAEDVIRDADTAMYEAKHRGRSQYTVFDSAMRDRVHRRMELEADLRTSLERNQLALHYQPIVALDTGRMVSAEALLRWDHPTRGFVSPSEFVPLAEETGLILPLGDWVVRTAFWQLADFQAQVGGDPEFRLSINLSRQQLLSKEWIERLPDYAADAGIDPHHVQFEITEGTVMRDVDASSAALQRLREMGFKLAIDDFGTGYSSLSCLHQFPIDVLKMDRELTLHLDRGQEYVGMVNAIMLLAWNLGIQVVAEGVETLDHLQMLQGLNCHYAQGFYFGRAVPAEDLFALDKAA